ncbi:MAG: PhzF family phenazine biosynthesis protein [bacterium]
MKIPLYQIDAFASEVFKGNPAAVCPLQDWLDDTAMQAIAQENNLSETAFFVKAGKGFRLRWFTPVAEVDLCGHATLASAYVIFNVLNHKEPEIEFTSKSGKLIVSQKNGLLTMNFPSQPPEPCSPPYSLLEGLGKTPVETLAHDDYLVVYENEDDVLGLDPDIAKLNTIDRRGVIVSAKGNAVDFVSRFFAPKYGVGEDPVTGSAHCILTPYWAAQLEKTRMSARQISKRGGELICELQGERVFISGRAVKYMEGEIFL